VSGNPNHLEKKIFRLDKCKGNVFLEVFVDAQCLVHYKFIPEVLTVNKRNVCRRPAFLVLKGQHFGNAKEVIAIATTAMTEA
jgi:hypothetical protein